MKIVKFTEKTLEKICSNSGKRKIRVKNSVEKILHDVSVNGDKALIKYSKKFDKVTLTQRQIKVTQSETNGAYQNIDAEFITSLKTAINNIISFYKKQVKKTRKIKQFIQ